MSDREMKAAATYWLAMGLSLHVLGVIETCLLLLIAVVTQAVREWFKDRKEVTS